MAPCDPHHSLPSPSLLLSPGTRHIVCSGCLLGQHICTTLSPQTLSDVSEIDAVIKFANTDILQVNKFCIHECNYYFTSPQSFVSCTNFFPGQECNQSVVGYHLRRKIENSPALINRAFCLRVSLILALSHDRMVEQKMLWFDQDAKIAGTK